MEERTENETEEKKSAGKTLIIYVILMQIFMAIFFLILNLVIIKSVLGMENILNDLKNQNLKTDSIIELLINAIVIFLMYLAVPSIAAVLSAKCSVFIRRFHYTESAKSEIVYANIASLIIGVILFTQFKIEAIGVFLIIFAPVFIVSKNIILDSMLGRGSALDLIPEKEKPIDPLAMHVDENAIPIRIKNVELDVSNVSEIDINDTNIKNVLELLKLNCKEYFFAVIQIGNLNIKSVIAFNEQKTCIMELSKTETKYLITKGYTIMWPNIQEISCSGKIGVEYAVSIKYDDAILDFSIPKVIENLLQQKEFSEKYISYIDMKNKYK